MGNKTTILIILIAYMLLNVVVGIWVSRRSAKENAEGGFLQNYFAGGRSMGGVVLAMTLVATYTSAGSFLGGPGLAASVGLTQSWIAAVQTGTAFLTLGVIGKKLGIIGRRINAVSISDYLRARYKSKAVVILSSLALLVFFTTQMVAQFIGGATLLESLTGLPYKVGLLIFALVVVIYTAVGGFKAVVVTDTIQGFIMTTGTFLMIFFVLKAGGGLESLVSKLSDVNPGWDLMGKGKFGSDIPSLQPGFLLSYWVLVGIGVLGLPQTAVRGLGFKDTKSLHRAMIYGTLVVGVLMIGMHFIGTLAAPLLPKGGVETTDKVIPYVVMNYMPSWAAGVFLAAPLAAIMSTVDSLLILASATIIKDLYLNYISKKDSEKTPISEENGGKRIAFYSFGLTAAIGIVVFLFALNPPDIIVWINLFAMGGLEATFFWPLIGGLYWKRANAKCCIASTIVGLVTFILFSQAISTPLGVHAIVVALFASGLAFAITGLLTKEKPDAEILKNCF